MSSEQWHSDIVVTEALVKKCIEEQFSKLAPLQEIQCIGEGWDNKVFLVNRSIVFRFPRRKIAVQLIARENAVLVNMELQSTLKMPCPTYIGKPSADYPYPFHGYIMINGVSGCHADLSMEDRVASIKPLAHFLKELHDITEDKARAIGAAPQIFDRTETDRLIIDLKKRVKKIRALGVAQINEQCFEKEISIAKENNLDMSNKVLVHGDLYCRHLLFDHGKLAGIIDWGDTGINHCSVDLSVVFSFYPPNCHETFFSIYGAVTEESLIHARFLGLYSALTVMLYAHDTADILLFNEAKASVLRINSTIFQHEGE
jgi:aminoglycoside phosphotransferase (APT) family kinase protein